MIGARIKQARLLAGFTQKQLANRLVERGYTLTPAAISKYEKGKSYPPVQFLLLASSEMNVRSTYFSHQPSTTISWKSFRRQSRFGKKKQDGVKAYAADLAELHIELHSLLYPNSQPDLPEPTPVQSPAEAEEVANRLRDKWKLGNRPLDNLVQTAEDRSLVVISWDDESGKFDGLSGTCGAYPVTVINSNRSTDRIRFSLAHEIGHLVMDTSDVSTKDEERLAHRFAGALLVSAEQAFHELGRRRAGLDWGELRLLKRKYGLSMAAWVIRARDLGIISEHHYSAMFEEYGRRGWRKQEPVEYVGDEEPLQLKQMAHRAVSEGLMSPDRITRIGLDSLVPVTEETESEHLTVRDLLAMPEDERRAVMERAFALAAEDDFEVFDTYDDEDFYDESIHHDKRTKSRRNMVGEFQLANHGSNTT